MFPVMKEFTDVSNGMIQIKDVSISPSKIKTPSAFNSDLKFASKVDIENSNQASGLKK